MPTIVCMFGLLVAALFAIFAHAGSDHPVAGQTTWIDVAFWAIVIASAAPLLIDWALDSLKRVRTKLSRRRPDSVRKTETV